MKPDFHIFGGYVWYAYPKTPSGEITTALLNTPGEDAKACFRIKDFVGASYYSNYRDEGLLLVTETATKPDASREWDVVPLSVPDGFGGKVNENTVIRHIYTLSENPDAVFSFFIGLRIPQE